MTRVRRRAGLAVVALALVLAAGCASTGSTPRSSDATTGPTAEPRDQPHDEAEVLGKATAIVDGEDSLLSGVAIDARDADRRVAIWLRATSRFAVVTTDDGFATRTVTPRVFRNSASVAAGPRGGLVVSTYPGSRIEHFVVVDDGGLVEATRSEVAGPLGPTGVVAGMDFPGGIARQWAVEVDTAQAHPLTTPADLEGTVTQLPGGQLRALTRDGYHWSDDAGSTWTSVDLPRPTGDPRIATWSLLASGPDDHVVMESGDGATLAPWVATWSLDTGPLTWAPTAEPDDPRAYVSGGVAMPDGTVVMLVTSWSDDRAGSFTTAPGLYRRAPGGAAALLPIGAPFDDVRRFQPIPLEISVDRDGDTDGARITLFGPDDASAYVTEDLGETWTEVPAR